MPGLADAVRTEFAPVALCKEQHPCTGLCAHACCTCCGAPELADAAGGIARVSAGSSGWLCEHAQGTSEEDTTNCKAAALN